MRMLAFIDDCAGLIPCTVLGLQKTELGLWVKFRVTTDKYRKYGYPKGRVDCYPAPLIVPRDAVIADQMLILPHDWREIAEEVAWRAQF